MSDPTARDHILDAAERLFAARGFPRTTIKQIGHEAGVNSALMYYYFGDKGRLYRQVLHRLVGSLIQGAGRGLDAGGSPERRLRAFLQAQAETLAANPRFARLLVRELADSDAAYAVEQIQLLAGSIFRMVRQGQRVIFDLDGQNRATRLRLGSEVDMGTFTGPPPVEP